MSSANPSVAGDPVTFTATVTGFLVPPAGDAHFQIDGVTVATVTLDGAGKAAFTTGPLTAGSHSVVVVFEGDPLVFNPSTSSTLTQAVTANATTTTVSASPNPSALTQSVTFTATVASAGGTPTGDVTFYDGATNLGTGTLDGSGQATFSTSILLPGTHSITAAYGGDANFAVSTSLALTQTVNLGISSTALVSSSNPSEVGQSVTFTATVTGLLTTPTGNVTFMDGATTLGSGALNGSGQATFSTSTLALGGHSITAEYGGNLIYAANTSNTVSQTVNQATTSTAVSSSDNPSASGATVTFTATVTSAGGTPTGSVTFKDGAATIGTGTLSGGVATFDTAALTVGSHPITAVYDGDTNFATSTSALLTQEVVANASATALVSSVNPSAYGQSVTFTATVTGTGGPPTGTVIFRDGTTVLGSGTLDGAGVATYSTTALAAGNHSITARYTGSSSFGMSLSPAVVQAVGQNATTANVVSSANPSPYGASVTFTATVNGAGGTPTGTVTFMDGATVLGSGPLDGSSQATLSTAALIAGNHAITVVYAGDGNFTGSTSPVLTQTIGQNAASVALVSSANPSPARQPIRFTATVTATGGTPTGNVTFFDGTRALGTSALTAGAAALTIATLPIGTHAITAVYGGDTNFSAAASAVLNQSVSIPADSLKLRAMQLKVTRLSAQVSGQAISGAIDSAVSEGLAGGCNAVTPSSSGLRLSSYQPDTANSRVRNGFAALRDNGRPAWIAWADTRGTEWRTDAAKGDVAGRQLNALIGLTHRLSPNLVAGVFGGYESFNYHSDDLDARMHGGGWTAGGYIGWQITAGLRFDAGIAQSGIKYDGSAGTASGAFSGARTLVQAGLTGSIALAKNWLLEPSTRTFAQWEKDGAYVDSLGTPQETRSFMSGRASAGAKLTYQWQASRTLVIAPYAGLYADYNFSKDNDHTAATPAPDIDGESAHAVVGVTARSGNGQISIEGEAGGLGGGDFSTWSLRSRATLTF